MVGFDYIMKKVKAVLASLAAAIALGVAFHNDLDKTLRKENPGGYSQQEVIFEKDRTDKMKSHIDKRMIELEDAINKKNNKFINDFPDEIDRII